MVIELIVILLLTFTLRLLFAVSRDTDDFVHFWNIRFLKECRKKKLGEVSNSVIKGYRGYPVLHHWIISLFPERLWGLAGKSLCIGYECCTVLTVYIATRMVLTEYGLTPADHVGFSYAGLVALLTATAPILSPFTSRVKTIGARTFGLLLTFLFFLAMGGVLLFHANYLLLVCVVLGLMIVATSQFALQVMAGASLFLGCVYRSFFPIIPLCAVIAVIFAFPGLGLKLILVSKYHHYKWYSRHVLCNTAPIRRENLKNLVFLPYYLIARPKKFLQSVFSESSYVIAAYSIPPLLIAAFVVPAYGKIGPIFEFALTRYVCWLVLFSLIAFIITSQRPFLFLGQAERYFEYSAPFVYFLFVVYITQFETGYMWLEYLLVVQICIVVIIFGASNRDQVLENIHFSPGMSLEPVLSFLNTLDTRSIITIPTKLSFRLSYFLFNSHRFYYRFILSKENGFAYMDEDHVDFDAIRPDFNYFKRKYGIDLVVIDKHEYAKLHATKGVEYSFEAAQLMYENERYRVMAISVDNPNPVESEKGS